MPVFLTLTDADISDPVFWASLNITPDSTINVSGMSDTVQVTLSADALRFTDTATGTATTYTDADLGVGSFSAFVEFTGNNADSVVSGSTGLNAGGYSGGSGNDTFVDSGTLGGQMIGGEGNDLLIGGIGSNNLFGGDGDDTLRGGSGNNNLSGGDGADTLFGEDGSGNLDGGDGDDVIHAGLNTTFVQGGDGVDSLILPPGSSFTPFSTGSEGGTVSLPNGRSFVYINIQGVEIACFTDGTRIRTPTGDMLIEDLAQGDLVETLDHGPKPIRWIGRQTVRGRGKYAPICFEPGSIGNTHRLLLSPQHRVLMEGWPCELLFHNTSVLCAAKHLCDANQIYVAPCSEVTYTHFMFDRHEIVFANNAAVESFYTGEIVSDADQFCHDEVMGIFHTGLNRPAHPAHAARPFLKKFEASLLVSQAGLTPRQPPASSLS